jgi:hypothetical protein
VDAGGVGFGLLFVQRVARRHFGAHCGPGRPTDGPGAVFGLTLGKVDDADVSTG